MLPLAIVLASVVAGTPALANQPRVEARKGVARITFTSKAVLDLRLYRGIFRHGHLGAHREISLVAYDMNGKAVSYQKKKIGKRQTYTSIKLLPALAGADRIIVKLN